MENIKNIACPLHQIRLVESEKTKTENTNRRRDRKKDALRLGTVVLTPGSYTGSGMCKKRTLQRRARLPG